MEPSVLPILGKYFSKSQIWKFLCAPNREERWGISAFPKLFFLPGPGYFYASPPGV